VQVVLEYGEELEADLSDLETVLSELIALKTTSNTEALNHQVILLIYTHNIY